MKRTGLVLVIGLVSAVSLGLYLGIWNARGERTDREHVITSMPLEARLVVYGSSAESASLMLLVINRGSEGVYLHPPLMGYWSLYGRTSQSGAWLPVSDLEIQPRAPALEEMVVLSRNQIVGVRIRIGNKDEYASRWLTDLDLRGLWLKAEVRFGGPAIPARPVWKRAIETEPIQLPL